ncbi:MAG: SIS domain-containing protein [Rhizobiales bacterium]|nr:SIS domain-containing protein [Hyphomicrobiales bacterium]
MLNFDEARFIRIQSGAVAAANDLRGIVAETLAKGIDNLVFLGTGGAAILMEPAAWLMQRQSAFPAFVERSAELPVAGSRRIGPRSLVILPSLSGTTSETVAALAWCNSRGARTVSLVGHADTPLGRDAGRTVVNFAEDDTSCESFYVQSLAVALAIMADRGEFDGIDALFAELARLPEALLEAKRRFEPEAKAFAEAIAAAPWHIVSGAGMAWPQAFYYGMCILEEMQWIRTRPVHASDFFHGTLELVDEKASVILLKGEDAARPLADRVERFARERAGHLLVLDAAAHAAGALSPRLRALVSPVILATLLERVSAHLEVIRNHPLTTRRYYKRVPY